MIFCGNNGGSMQDSRTEAFAVVHGSPGTRVRFVGLVRLFWPFAAGMFVAGYLARCGLPAPGIAPFAAGVALLVLAGVVWWLHGRAVARFGAFLKGARGEELVARELALLPGGFEVFHGVPDPAGGGDFDHVVSGPGGVALVETKYWSGPVTYVDGELLARGVRPTRSPIAQVRREAARLQARLAALGVDGLHVLPVICLAGDPFAEEWLEADGLVVCNCRSLCALLLARIGDETRTKDSAGVEGILLTLLEGGGAH